MMTAREEILNRIRTAKGASSAATAATAYADIERKYQSAAELSHSAILRLFEERLRDYDANVYRIAPFEAGATVAEILRSRNIHRVLVPDGLPTQWKQGAEFVIDRGFTASELDAFTSVMTTATLGIAETGTIVLQTSPGQGRRAVTLVPDYHLCILPVGRVVETVVEAMRLLEPTKSLPTTFFSGPSATADIEMTRIKGVHGPRFVDVVLLAETSEE